MQAKSGRMASIAALMVFCLFLCVKATIARQDSADAALIAIARAAVRAAVLMQAPPPLPQARTAQTEGVFVTIEQHGRIIGCRGALTPRKDSLEAEVQSAAIAAAAHDPRYGPVQPDALQGFLVTVTVVERLEDFSLQDIDALTAEDGLVLTRGSRTGVVLPYEGRDSRQRLRWAYEKAGLPEGAFCTLRRMIARRFRG